MAFPSYGNCDLEETLSLEMKTKSVILDGWANTINSVNILFKWEEKLKLKL